MQGPRPRRVDTVKGGFVIAARVAAVLLALLLVPAGAVGTSGPGARCLVGTDSRTDSTANEPVRPADAAAELIAVQMGVAGGALVADVQVARIPEPAAKGDADGARGNRWEVAWGIDVPGQEWPDWYVVAARRFGGVDDFWFETPEGVVPASGSIDESSGVVRMAVPRPPIGTRLEDVSAAAATLVGSRAVSDLRDWMPGDGSSLSYVVGRSCGEQSLRACPVAADDAGDAGLAAAPETNQPALDLLGAGAESSRDTLTLSARVADMTAPPPAGFDLTGWTVSWAYEGIRWAAQAERYADGSLVFRYGATAANEDELPGPYFGGVATNGTVDAANGVLTVDVPRASVGDPADGEALADLGAQSWAMATGNTASPYQIADATEMRSHRMGVACGV